MDINNLGNYIGGFIFVAFSIVAAVFVYIERHES